MDQGILDDKPTAQAEQFLVRAPLLQSVLFGMALLMVIAFSVRLVVTWKNYGQIDHTAGTWTAMALDARDGMLYRPVVSEIGYGGTRYMPVHVVMQAELMKFGMGPVASGYLLDAIGIGVTLGGLYCLMRQLNVPAATAIPMVCFVLAASCYRTTSAGIKGDLLPAGLNLWGLAAIVAARSRSYSREIGLLVLVAAVCFTIAFAAKITSIFGIGAAAFWLFWQRRLGLAILLCLEWIVGAAIAVILTQWASDGRAIAIFRQCAAGGGGIADVFHGPFNFLNDVLHHDRTFLGFWIIALALIAISRRWKSLPAIFLFVTTLGTMAIYGSPGTNMNHVVDVCAAAVLVIAVQINLRDARTSIAAGLTMLLVAAAFLGCMKRIGEIRREAVHDQIMAVLADTHHSFIKGPLLAENPILPIIEGDRPYLLDSFMLRTIRLKHPEIAGRFWDDLDHQNFRAVILDSPPNDIDYQNTIGDFGPGFIERMGKNYTLFSTHGDFYVFLPKAR